MPINRRQIIGAVVSTGIIGISGCSSQQEPEIEDPGVQNYSFSKISSEDAPDNPEINETKELSDGSMEITVVGTVEVKNECMDIQIENKPEMTSSSDPVRVKAVIETYKSEDGMCAEVITPIGYELNITCKPAAEEVTISQGGINSQTQTLEI